MSSFRGASNWRRLAPKGPALDFAGAARRVAARRIRGRVGAVVGAGLLAGAVYKHFRKNRKQK